MKVVQRAEAQAPQRCYTYCLTTRSTHNTGGGSPGKVQQPPIRAAIVTMQGYTLFQARVRAPSSVASQVWSQDASCLVTSSVKACLFSISDRYKPRSWWAPWLNANRGTGAGTVCSSVHGVSIAGTHVHGAQSRQHSISTPESTHTRAWCSRAPNTHNCNHPSQRFQIAVTTTDISHTLQWIHARAHG